MMTIDGWSNKKLSELATYINGYAFKPDDWEKDGLPIVRIEQLKNPDASTDYFSGKLPQKNIIENGDLIFSWSASLFLSIWQHGQAALNQHLFKVIEKDSVDRVFLKLFIEFYLPELTKASHGSTMQHITRKELDRFDAPFPTSKSEQTKIAEVLSTVDRVIEQTEALIVKQQRIKTGLMQDLLTRGIDEHGNLRSEQTHKFKDSKTPLGRIPVEWEVKMLSDCYAEPARNGLYKTKEFYGAGNSMVHMPQMFRGLTVDLTSAVRVQVDRSEIDRFGLQANDLLIARRSLVLEGAGRCALVPVVTEPTTFESSIIRVRLMQDRINATFANFFLNSDAGYRMRLPFIRQVAVSGVAGEDVGQFYIPVPEADEQRRIIDCFSKSEVLICGMVATANKLKRQKTALMQDLLTGKKHVTPLLTEPQEAGA